MKVAITSTGELLTSAFDTRFGRAAKFIIYDTKEKSFIVLDNKEQVDSPSGAGVQAAQVMINNKVDALITGHLGPKAGKVIFAAGIEVYQTDAESVEQALAMYTSKALKPLKGSNVDGQWV
ncbi:MAG: NifB/NifX family molybdenum-iron cluster-binding protein [Sphaerochaetaceae bacterium]|jgi:predicted Fe-Mo cluster-binding NifX family protein